MGALARSAARLGHSLWRLWLRRRLGREVVEEVAGLELVVLPEVFNPAVFRTGEPLARAIAAQPAGGDAARALDLGTGCGLGAICAARAGYRVVAVDINLQAVECAALNARRHGLADRIEVRAGDLFAPVGDERFDLVIFNPPFFRGAPRDPLDQAWRSEDVLERFAAELADHLRPGGGGLVLLSTDGEGPAWLERSQAAGLSHRPVGGRRYATETLTVFRVEPRQAAAAAGSRGAPG